MGLWQAPKVTNDMDVDQLKNLVQKLIYDLDFVINGKIDSKNVREIGGYEVSKDYLRSKDGVVGLSSAKLGGGLDDVRIWAGSAAPEVAPFRVYNSGKAVLSNLELTGGTISWGSVNSPTPADVGAVDTNDPRLSQLSSIGNYLGQLAQSQVTDLPGKLVNINSIGDYIGALSQGQVTGLSTRLTKITSTGVYTGTVGTDQLIAGSALIGNALIDNIAANKILAGELTGFTIQTALSGQRIVMNNDGFITYDTNARKRLNISTDGGYGLAGLEFYDENAVYKGVAFAGASEGLALYGYTHLRLQAQMGSMYLNANTGVILDVDSYLGSSFLGNKLATTGQLDNIYTQLSFKANLGSSTTSAGSGSYNGGIGIGTQLMVAGGGYVTWAGITIPSHQHTQT